MAISYDVNKGVDKTLEIKGINEKYLYLILGYSALSVLLAIILRMLGLGWIYCVLLCFAGVGASWGYAAKMSKKYGQYGLLKRTAHKIRPRYIRMSSRDTFLKL